MEQQSRNNVFLVLGLKAFHKVKHRALHNAQRAAHSANPSSINTRPELSTDPGRTFKTSQRSLRFLTLPCQWRTNSPPRRMLPTQARRVGRPTEWDYHQEVHRQDYFASRGHAPWKLLRPRSRSPSRWCVPRRSRVDASPERSLWTRDGALVDQARLHHTHTLSTTFRLMA